jgi:hypothetical protein
MTNPASCDECEAIARELDEAYLEAWISSDQTTRDAWIATYKLIGGTEEDAARADELIPRARIRNPLRIRQALVKKFTHEARSRHKVPWQREQFSS